MANLWFLPTNVGKFKYRPPTSHQILLTTMWYFTIDELVIKIVSQSSLRTHHNKMWWSNSNVYIHICIDGQCVVWTQKPNIMEEFMIISWYNANLCCACKWHVHNNILVLNDAFSLLDNHENMLITKMAELEILQTLDF